MKYSIQTLILFTITVILGLQCASKSVKTAEVQQIDQPEANPPDDEATLKPDFQMALFQRGIDFYARGNEPFWSLDMDFEQHFQFKTMDGFQISVPPVSGSKAMDAKVTRYFAEVESGSLIITIQEGKCQDSMADQEFNFIVRVQVKLPNEDNFVEYEGCGNFVPDYSLHDIWVVEKLNGKDLKLVGKGKELPRFEFFAGDGKVLGYAGCNDFNGKYAIVGRGEIQFEAMSMTKKLCPEMEIENILVKSVFGRRMKYSREELNLRLTGYDGTELLLKKVD